MYLWFARARDIRIGDHVVFDMPGANYVVEDVETTQIGQIRHVHGDGTASSCYWPTDLLYVEVPGSPEEVPNQLL